MFSTFRATFILLLGVFIATSVPAPAVIEGGGQATEAQDRQATIPNNPEVEAAIRGSRLDMVVVNHEGWRETLPTFARLKIYEITGRTRIAGQDPQYTVLSMMYERDKWASARIIPVEHPDISEALGLEGKWVTPRQVSANPGINDFINRIQEGRDIQRRLNEVTNLLNAIEQVHRLGREDRVLNAFEFDGITPQQILDVIDDREEMRRLHSERDSLRRDWNSRRPFVQAAERIITRTQILSQLSEEFLVIPDTESVDGRWVRPAAFNRGGPLMEVARDFDNSLSRAILMGQPEVIGPAVDRFLDVAEMTKVYPSEMHRRVLNNYVAWNPWRLSAWIYLFGAMFMGLHIYFRYRPWYWTAAALLGIGFLIHTSAVGARLYLTGHAPVSNMFEAVTFFSWTLMLLAVAFEGYNRKGIVALGAMILAFLFLIGAGLMPLHQTRLHPIRAVLNSYWLNIHVTLMLLSYAAFAIAFFFASLYLVRSFLGRSALFGGTPILSQDATEEFAYRLVQLGWPILTFGVALGAVWADTAWGRYWGWDPKETWALITWVSYTVYLHTRMVLGWRGRWSAIACVIGFVMVLITWFGVSYLPWFAGGLHTYASPS
ncbi:MAG: c-type cytochrome biogenesis protein CcsB [Candidatus Sumerlaeia bacterium]|nr:c-type cytochrome biogenesis protein CcsB [Candidatus Sumerlaeia bacterium]